MVTGWDRPQEEEFALCNMGLPSPYLTMAFPNEPPQFPEYLTLDGLTAEEIERWKAGLEWFLKRVTHAQSPAHLFSSRRRTPRESKPCWSCFPTRVSCTSCRDPYEVFGSTVRLWKTLYKFQALQVARHEGLEEYVFSCFERMYEKFERDRALIDPSRFFEVRYEDLVRDPIGQMRSLYDQFDLGEFDVVLPKLQAYLKDTQDYRTSTPRFPTTCATRSIAAGDPLCASTVIASRPRPRRHPDPPRGIGGSCGVAVVAGFNAALIRLAPGVHAVSASER